LCSIDDKGNIPSFEFTHITACLIASGIMELYDCGYVEFDNENKLLIFAPLDKDLLYLKPLYDIILSHKKNMTVKELSEIYLWGFNNKSLEKFLMSLGSSLVLISSTVERYSNDLFGSKKKYIPQPEDVTSIIENIRVEVFERGTMNKETVRLVALLDKSNIIKRYFSKTDTQSLKKHLRAICDNKTHSVLKEILDFTDKILAAVIISTMMPT